MSEKNPVYFVGAGPGDPELITVRGKCLLAEAHLVVYTGSLVPKALLRGLRAEVHDSAGLDLDRILDLMIAAFRAGKKVVRLHTGDPAIFGALNEQIAALAREAIPFRVVPGVSSVTAAAASLATQLTLPEISQTVIVTRRAGRTPMPEKEDLISLAGHQATMLILLSIRMIDQVVEELLAGGYPADTPVAVVEKVSWPEERQLRGTLATITGQVKAAGINRTAIIVVGRVLTQAPPPALSRLYDTTFSHAFRQGSAP